MTKAALKLTKNQRLIFESSALRYALDAAVPAAYGVNPARLCLRGYDTAAGHRL